MNISLREAAPADEAAVVALWHACELTRPWNDPAADFARALAFAGSTIVVAELDGEAIGTAMTGFDGHRGWIYYLAVHPACRRRGSPGNCSNAAKPGWPSAAARKSN